MRHKKTATYRSYKTTSLPKNSKDANSGADLLDRVKTYLVKSGYRPGDRINTEVELATTFHVSRARIREVTRSLSQLGVLESRRRRGTVLKSFDPIKAGEHLGFRFVMAGLNPADSLEARQVIEQAILPLTIRRMTPARLSALEEAIERMERNSTDLDEVYRADRDFHIQLLQACGNQTLQLFAQVIQGVFDELYRGTALDPDTVKRSIAEHRQLVGAIGQGDIDEARRILRDHLSRPFRGTVETHATH